MHRPAPRSAAPLLIALAAAAALPPPPLLGAQTTLPAAADLRPAPAESPIATLRARTPVVAGPARDGFTQVTVSGYINASLLAAGRAPFNWQVKAPKGALLRAAGAAGAPVVAELRDGTGLVQISRSRDWVRVRRSGWVKSELLGRGGAAPAARSVAQESARPPARASAAGAAGPRARPAAAESRAATATPADSASAYAAFGDASDAVSATALAPVRETSLSSLPGGRSIATLGAEAVVTPLVRSDGWVRVRVEGWVHESELAPAGAERSTLAAAHLRADPDGTRNKVVHWDVEFLALQTADLLRRDLAPDEPYLLARGPVGENAIVYLAVPPALLGVVRGLQPLTTVTVTARVRNGRSEPIGVPVLELESIVRSKKR